jgi:hypothetical protein
MPYTKFGDKNDIVYRKFDLHMQPFIHKNNTVIGNNNFISDVMIPHYSDDSWLDFADDNDSAVSSSGSDNNSAALPDNNPVVSSSRPDDESSDDESWLHESAGGQKKKKTIRRKYKHNCARSKKIARIL